MIRSNLALACSSLAVAGSLASPAQAQDQTMNQPAGKPVPKKPNPANTPVDSSTTEVARQDAGAIIVTAQKRAQPLRDVPVTVSVVDSKQMDQQHITSVADLSRAVPALSTGFPSGTAIRGVSTGGFTRSSEQAVSTVIDGVVMGKTAIVDLFDIDHVEVLSGPQGMLFGKNASAGVINIITNKPRFDRNEAFGSLEFGNYAHERERVTLNVPVTDNAALRLSGFHYFDEGLLTNTSTGQRANNGSVGGRARFRWEPAENVEVNLIGDFEHSYGNGISGFTFAIVPDPTGANAPLEAQLALCNITASSSNTKNCGIVSSRIAENKYYGFSGQIDWTLGGGYVLTSITARRWQLNESFGNFDKGGDSDFLQANVLDWNINPIDDRVFTQEFRLTSPAGSRVEFVAGLYYYRETTVSDGFQAGQLGFDAFFAPLLYPANTVFARRQTFNVKSTSYSAFGQATFHATDKLSLIAGGRFTHDKISDNSPASTLAELAPILSAQGYFLPTTPNPLLVFLLGSDPIYNVAFGFANGFGSVNETVKKDDFSWRVGAQYDFNRNVMAYATLAQGYKGPAVNDVGISPIPIIKPEIPLSFELGTKATLLQGKLFVAATLFHTKVKDFQTQIFAPGNAFLPAGFVQGNAPWMKTQGLDVTLLGHPLTGLTMGIGAIYTKAWFAPSFRVACAPGQAPGPADQGLCETLAPGVTATKANPQISSVPKFKLTANVEYAHEVSPGISAFIQSDAQYQTKTFTTPTPDPIQRLPAQFYLNGGVGIRSSTGRWSATVWGRNLLGKKYVTYVPDFLSFAPGHAGAYLTGPNTNWRTTYGATLSVHF